jgi:hypothetical protein
VRLQSQRPVDDGAKAQTHREVDPQSRPPSCGHGFGDKIQKGHSHEGKKREWHLYLVGSEPPTEMAFRGTWIIQVQVNGER